MEKDTWKPEVGKMAWTVFNDPFQIIVAEVLIAAVEPTSIGDLYYFAAHGRSFLSPRLASNIYPSAQAALASIKVVSSQGETLSVI